MNQLLGIALHRPIVLASLKVALLVGTVLNAINQGDRLFSDEPLIWSQVGLNFIVPYCVSSYSAALSEWRTTRRNNEA